MTRGEHEGGGVEGAEGGAGDEGGGGEGEVTQHVVEKIVGGYQGWMVCSAQIQGEGGLFFQFDCFVQNFWSFCWRFFQHICNSEGRFLNWRDRRCTTQHYSA